MTAVVFLDQRPPDLEAGAGAQMVRRQGAVVRLHQACGNRQAQPEPLDNYGSLLGTSKLKSTNPCDRPIDAGL